MTAYDVHDKDGFVSFLAQMRDELRRGASAWENIELPDFLEAMSAWITDWSSPIDENPWTHAAMLMEAGARYE